MKGKLRVGDLCISPSHDIYLVLVVDRKKPTSVLLLDSPKNRAKLGQIFTLATNSWVLTKVSGTITPLEKLIYGVTLEV